MNTQHLTDFINDKLVMCHRSEYEGIRAPTFEELIVLKALVELTLATATFEDIE
ncbi:MAG: hypothetical protein ACXW1D_00300 [Halobacteriota archaeon]